MGLFEWIFGTRKDMTPRIQYTTGPNDPDKLLKDATALKKQGDITGAIRKLKSAYKAIEKTNIGYSVKTFIRLPQYLQLAGQNDEAWREFNNLLLGFPNQLMKKELIPMAHSTIYDKMRLFLQKEKRYKKAVLFEMFSCLCWAKGLYLQKRRRDLKECRKPGHISHGLAKKAKILEKIDAYEAIVSDELKQLPDIDLARVERKFKEV